MKYLLITVAIVLLASCSSNPITPKVTAELRNQLSKEKMYEQLDSAMIFCNNNALEWEYNITDEQAENWRQSGETSYTRALLELQPNYLEICDSVKKVIGDYLKHWDWAFVTDTMLKPDETQAWQVLSFGLSQHDPNITWNDMIMNYIHYNRVPEPKLHLDEKVEDDYYKATDLKTAKQYLLEIKDDSLYSYKVLK